MPAKRYTGILPVAVGLAALGFASARSAQAQTLVDQYVLGSSNGDTTGTGGIIDDINSANDGTLLGGTTLGANSVTMSGAGSGAIGNTQSGYISLPNYTFAPGAYSFEEYLTPTTSTPGGYPAIFSYSTSTSNYLIAQSGRGGNGEPNASININNGTAYNAGGGNVGTGEYGGYTPSFTANTLNQEAIVVSGTSLEEFVNGTMVAAAPTTDTLSGLGTTTLNGIGGGSPYGDATLSGSVSEFNVYQGALSQAQIASDYTAATGNSVTSNFTMSTPDGTAGNGVTGLTETVYHLGTAQPDTSSAPSDGEITTLLNNIDSGAYSTDPQDSFVNSATTFNYSGNDVTPTNTYLGADAAGSAATDTDQIQTSLFDAKGYLVVTTPGVYTFLTDGDDGARITINGVDVSESNFGSGDIGPGQSNNVDFTQAGLYAVDVFTFNQTINGSGNGGGADFYFPVPAGLSFVTGLSAAPEPSQIGMIALMVFGLGGLLLKARKRQAELLA